MGKRFGVLAAAAACVALAIPAGAGAATEIGDNCVANDTLENPKLGLFEVANAANPLPTAAPASGVLTQWKTSSAIPAPVAVNHVLKVIRPLGPSAVQIVGESSAGIVMGSNSFDARIPVQAGDRLGLTSANSFEVTFLCESAIPSVLGIFPAEGTTGQTIPAAEGGGPVRIPVAAVIEPDADNDGFGDETQDQCPQSGAVQVACPVSVVDSFALARKNKVLVLVATSATTSVTVSGSARIPNARKRARSSAQARLPNLTKVVPAGTLTRFSLSFPAKLKSALRGLRRGRSLTLNLTATAPNLAGPATTDRARVKLKR